MKNKILTINIIFILFSLFFVSNSFAYTATEDIVCKEPTNSYLATAIAELQEIYPEDEYYYTYGYCYGPRCYQLVFFEKQYLKVKPYIMNPSFNFEGNDYYEIKISEDNSEVKVFYYKVYDNSYSSAGDGTYIDVVPAFTIVSNSTNPVEFTANFNVYANSSYSDFFLRTPVTGTLAPILETVETEMTLQEIILILPLIIVVVVCFLGLRKALQMLLSLLRRCLIT